MESPLRIVSIPRKLFAGLPAPLLPRRARADNGYLVCEYRVKGRPLELVLDVTGEQVRPQVDCDEPGARRTIARGLVANWARLDSLSLSCLERAITLSTMSLEALEALIEGQPAATAAREIAASARGGRALWSVSKGSEADARRDRGGLARARVLAGQGRGDAALECLLETPVTWGVSRRAVTLLGVALRADHPALAGPPPVEPRDQLVWIEQLSRTSDSHQALAVAADLVTLAPEMALDLIEMFPDAPEPILDQLPEPVRREASARLALWRGDTREARRVTVDDGSSRSVATRVGALVLDGELVEALALCRDARTRFPESVELALWEIDALIRSRQNRFALAEVERSVRVLASSPLLRLYRALADVESVTGREGGVDTRYLHRAIGRQILGEGPGDVSNRQELKWLSRALAAFGGNRSLRLTTVGPDGQLRRADIIEPRVEVVRLQHQVIHRPVEDVQQALADFSAEFPDVPFGPTYSAELDLFRGRYHEALAVFEESWRTTRTRWSYVGSGGALMMLGRYEDALTRFDEGERSANGLIPGEATHAYRGEALFRLGRLEEALPHLEYACEVEPRRVGAVLVLAQLYRALGRAVEAASALDDVRQRASPLIWEAENRGGDPIDTAVELLLGNRSSHLLTFFDTSGCWRVLPLAVCGTEGRRLDECFALPVYADDLWHLVAAGWNPNSPTQ